MLRRDRLARVSALSFLFLAGSLDARAQSLVRASVGPGGVEGDGDSSAASLSADGRWLAFASNANTLVPGDVNDFGTDLFVRDLERGVNELVSVDSAGVQPKGDSWYPCMTPDARFVVFTSPIANYVGGDTNNVYDVFVRDRVLGLTERVSLGANGEEPNRDCGTMPTGAASDDGRWVVFGSGATNLVVGKTTWWGDVFVRDRLNATTLRASVAWDGGEGDSVAGWQAISGDGRFVCFMSTATNFVPGDTNGFYDVFVRDLAEQTIERVSVSSSGLQSDEGSGSGLLSFDGRYVWFDSYASNLVAGDDNGVGDVFRRDRRLGITERVSVRSSGQQVHDYSWLPSPAAGGRFVSFSSGASDLVTGDTNNRDDVFVHDLFSGATQRVSLGDGGVQSDDFCDYSSISANGRYIAFESIATNLVPGDRNGMRDVFVFDRGPALVSTYCASKASSAGCTATMVASGTPSMSSSAPFLIGAQSVASGTSGWLFYGFAPVQPPFHASSLCVARPLVRTRRVSSGGPPGSSACSGVFEFDFDAYLARGANPALGPGREVFAQWWFVDPASASGGGFSDALLFTIQP